MTAPPCHLTTWEVLKERVLLRVGKVFLSHIHRALPSRAQARLRMSSIYLSLRLIELEIFSLDVEASQVGRSGATFPLVNLARVALTRV